MSGADPTASLTRQGENGPCPNTFVSRIYSRPYRHTALRQMEIGNIFWTGRALNVGRGSIHFGAMYTKLLTGAETWPIERRPDTARLEEKGVSSRVPQKRVGVTAMDAAGSIPQGSNSVLLTRQAKPSHIFRRLCESARSGRVSVFESRNRNSGLRDSLAELYRAEGVTRQDISACDQAILHEIPAHGSQRRK